MEKIYNTEQITLLLTGTIDTTVYQNVCNKITNIDERLSQYERSITKYIQETPFTRIVFIENSGYIFDVEKFNNLATAANKEFEFVMGSIRKNEILRYGKSYGDAVLISEALQKSKILNESEFFYKISGRIFLQNAKSICKTARKHRNEFIIYPNGWCYANLFKVNRHDWNKYFYDIQDECDDSNGKNLESALWKRINDGALQVKSFRAFPYFDGVMGTTLTPYSGNVFFRTIKSIMARLRMFEQGTALYGLTKFAIKIGSRKK